MNTETNAHGAPYAIKIDLPPKRPLKWAHEYPRHPPEEELFWECKIAFQLLETKSGFSLPHGFSISKMTTNSQWCIYLLGKHIDLWKNPDATKLTGYPTARLAIKAYILLRRLGFGAANALTNWDTSGAQ